MKLSVLVETSRDYELGKIEEKEFVDFLNGVYVDGFIPLKQKMMSVMSVLFDFDYDDNDIFKRYMQLEMNKFWYIVMKYTDIELEDEYITEENYDLLFPLVYNSVKQIAGIDFDYTMDLLETIKNDFEKNEIISVFSKLSETDFSELAKADKELLNDLNNNKDLVNDLVQLFNHTNPHIKKINQELEKKIMNEIKEKK